MRQIHPVGFHEKFVASGVFTYLHDGNPLDTQEYWSIHELPDGGQLIRVDLDWVEWSLLIEGWRGPSANGGRIERADTHIWGAEKNGIRSKATYLFESDRAQVGYVIGDQARQQKEIALPTGYVVSIRHSTLLWGFTIAEVAKANGKCIPLCECFSLATGFREPRISEASMVLRESSNLVIAGTTVKARLCQWHHHCDAPDKPIDPKGGPFFWIDEYDILLLTDDSKMSGGSVRLTQYAHRPEPPRSP
jgi:hypothetical protein